MVAAFGEGTLRRWRNAMLALLALTSGAAGAVAELDESVQASLAMRPAGAIRVILQLEGAPPLADHAPVLQALAARQRPGALAQRLRGPFIEKAAPLLERLRSIGAQDIQPLWLAHAVSVEMPRSRIREVAAWPGIRRVDSDVALRAQQPGRRSSPAHVQAQDEQARAALARAAAAATAAASDARDAPARTREPWQLAEHLVHVDAPRAWLAGLDGRGTTVAVVDSGVDLRVPALAAAYRAGRADWFDPYVQHQLPHDGNGHGTLVASLLVGRADADGAPSALAPDARFIAARLFDDAGHGRLSAVHRIYQWLLDPDGDERTADAPQVVNNSWGFTGTTGQCNLRLARLWQAFEMVDVAVVFAAGNDGPHEGTSMSPANNPGVIAVGALGGDGQQARQSSRGPSACRDAGGASLPFPRLFAPGVALPALDRIGAAAGVAHRSDGTSFAAAVASGALLLLRQREPSWSVPQLVQELVRRSVAAAPAAPAGLQLGTLAAAGTQPVRQALGVSRPADGRLDASSLRASLPRGVGIQRIELAGRAPGRFDLNGDSAVWTPADEGAANLDLVLTLSDGTRQPLRVVQAVPEPAGRQSRATVLSARRDTPVMLEAPAPQAAAPADTLHWSQPLRGGRIERDARGRWLYRPPAGFLGTDQFALRTAEGPLIFKVVVRP